MWYIMWEMESLAILCSFNYEPIKLSRSSSRTQKMLSDTGGTLG